MKRQSGNSVNKICCQLGDQMQKKNEPPHAHGASMRTDLSKVFPTYLLSNLLIQCEAGQYGQSEHDHSQTVVSQEVDQSAIERLYVLLHEYRNTRFTHKNQAEVFKTRGGEMY